MTPDMQVAVVGLFGTALTAAATVVVAIIQTRAKQREQLEAREDRGIAEVNAREHRAEIADLEALVALLRQRCSSCEGVPTPTGTTSPGHGGAHDGSARPGKHASDAG